MKIKLYVNDEKKLEDVAISTLQKLHAAAVTIVQDSYHPTIESLTAQIHRYETVLEKIEQGVCFFDGDKKLILCNRRYAEIYGLSPQDIIPGTTLREIIECRVAAGTASTKGLEDYLSEAHTVNQNTETVTRTANLVDGREIVIWNQPMPDGGWVSTHDDITKSKNKSISLQTLIDSTPDYLWVKDIEGRFLIANRALAVDSGLGTTAEMIGLSDFDFHAPGLAEKFFADEQAIIRSAQNSIDKEEMVFDLKGGMKWLSSSKIPLRADDGSIFGLVGIARDITSRKQEETLRSGQSRVLEMIAASAPLKEVLDHLVLLMEAQMTGIVCSILFLDNDGVHLRHGSAPNLPEAFCNAVDGLRIGPNVGSCGTAAYLQKSVIVSDIMIDPLWTDFKHLAARYDFRSCWSTPVFSHDDEMLGTFAMYSSNVREPTAAELGLIEISTRIAGIAIERNHAEERIQFLATHDALTGLPNRTLLKDRLAQAISHAERSDRSVSVIFVDLDKFKEINDSMGHSAGDELLKAVAGRMVGCVRSVDTVVRLGGDEFVILLFDLPKNGAYPLRSLNRIRAAISETINFKDVDIHVTASIGIANYPDNGLDADTLLANADTAMYRAKEIGRDNFQFYTRELNTSV